MALFSYIVSISSYNLNMKKLKRPLLIFFGSLLVIILIGPFLIPVPALKNVVPVQELSDPDSLFIEINGIDFHYKISGDGEIPVILLHGFGASAYSWHEVLDQFGGDYTVYAYDRPAFGLTERPIEWEGDNPYSRAASVAQLLALMNAWGVEQAILVGNSAGGGVAMEFALAYPESVLKLILVSPAVSDGKGGRYNNLRPLFNTPQMQRLGPLLVREVQEYGLEMLDDAWHDLEKRPAETLEAYQIPLQAENWDKGLWYYSTADNVSDLPDRLDEFSMPVLILAGDDDRIVATQRSIDLALKIPGSKLVILPGCGHVPQEECPQDFMDALVAFIK